MAPLAAAQVFKMPAMSPTMTEGGIVSWKYKSGDEFSAGDVLLEVETDKATIDVEAQDDGVMWEILVKEGESGIPVGKPIAFLAEPGDDLGSLEKPPIDEGETGAKEAQQAEQQKEQPKDVEKSRQSHAPKAASQDAPSNATPKSAGKESNSQQPSDGSVTTKADASQKLTPAVEVFLHRHDISPQEAFDKIPASGPKGRLLLGDVLAYVGEIKASAVTKIALYIKSKEHLDLSNIKVAAPAKKEPPASKPAEKPKPSNVLRIEFTSELREDVTKERFQLKFERALHAAKKQTYGIRFPNYARLPISLGLYEDDIFDDLLVAPVSKDRFSVSNIGYKFLGESLSRPRASDAFDELLGLAPKPAIGAEPAGSLTAVVSFQVTFDEKLSDSRQFVDFFQDALLSQIPAKLLVVKE